MDHTMEGESCSSEFSCLTCGKVLKHKYSLERHVRVVHGGYRPFLCECGKSFATQEQFTRHTNSKHTYKKPYPCLRGCDKAFASYTARTYHHQAIHDQVKYKCPVAGCEKTYSAKIHLQNHMRRPHPAHLFLIHLINTQT